MSCKNCVWCFTDNLNRDWCERCDELIIGYDTCFEFEEVNHEQLCTENKISDFTIEGNQEILY